MLLGDRIRLREIADMHDEAGVLSVYATVDPQQEAASSPVWPVQIRNELNALVHRLRDAGEDRRLAALRSRLSDLEPILDGLLDAAAPGRGRAMFVPLSRPEVRTLSIQLPLINRVVLDPAPHLYPLVAADNAGAPAGVVAVGAHGVRAVDYRFGLAHEVLNVPYEQPTGDWRELTGPGAASPGLGQRSASQRDLYTRKVTDHLTHFLAAVTPRIVHLVDEACWDDVVITGERGPVAAVAAALPRDLAARITTAAHVVPAGLGPARVAALAAPDIDAARRDRGRRMAERARDAALAGGAGAYGLADTLAALAEGRVTHLVLEGSRQWAGIRTPDGRLYPNGEIPPGTPAGELVAEPDLAERMIEAAYRHGGGVTLVEPGTEPLATGGGVAATLRW